MIPEKNHETFIHCLVDESGDEGFVFNEDGTGSSRWFVLSAAVIRQTNDLQMVGCLKEVRSILKKEPKTPLHFVDLKHEQRCLISGAWVNCRFGRSVCWFKNRSSPSRRSFRTTNICSIATLPVCCWSGFHGFAVITGAPQKEMDLRRSSFPIEAICPTMKFGIISDCC